MVAAAEARGPRHPTKGRTSAGRLRLLDSFLRHCPPPSLSRPVAAGTAPVVVDLGIGESAATSSELLEVLRGLPLAPVRVIAVEQAPHRVARARATLVGTPELELRQGGLPLPLHTGEDVRWVRVMNVLRSYPLEAAREAHAILARQLPEGTWVWEGSTDPRGHLLCCHLLRAQGGAMERSGLLFATDFGRGFAPLQFRDCLPRDLRRRVRPGHPLHTFFARWTEAFEAVREAGVQASEARFVASVQRLGEVLPDLDLNPALLGAGMLAWRPRGGVPL